MIWAEHEGAHHPDAHLRPINRSNFANGPPEAPKITRIEQWIRVIPPT